MTPRPRQSHQRITLVAGVWLAVGTALLATGGFLVDVFSNQEHPFDSAGLLAVFAAGLLALVLGVYVFVAVFWPKLPLPEPRRWRAPAARPLWPPPGLPLWLSPLQTRRSQANFLIMEGQGILRSLPIARPANPLEQLARTMHRQGPEKRIAQWEERTKLFLQVRAPGCTGLFNSAPDLPLGDAPLRAYLEARIDELTQIHARL